MLTAQQVKHLAKPGRHHDGRGLYLNVTAKGSRSWVQRIVVDGRRRDIGLGGYPAVSLAQARRRAEANRSAVADGRDPIAEKRRAAVPTFGEAAVKVHAMNLPKWRNDHAARFWLRSLELHAARIWSMPLDRIQPTDVIACLESQWTVKAETMRRVRQRMQSVFRWAMAHGYITTNPAGEIISAALPSQPKVKRRQRAAHYLDLPDILQTVRDSHASMAAKACIEFIALTAARSGEARLASWSEIDFDSAVWSVPAERMKRGILHRVPLSHRTLEVLDRAKVLHDGSGHLFPSPLKPGRPLTSETLLKVFADHGIDSSVHGLRSAFKTWAVEQTTASWATTEACLAHNIGDATEMSYVRGDLFAKRRALLDEWADFLNA